MRYPARTKTGNVPRDKARQSWIRGGSDVEQGRGVPRIADRGRHRRYVAELGTAGETTTTAIDTADTTNTTNTTHCIHYGVPVLVGAQWKAKSPVSGTWSTSREVLCSIAVQSGQQ